MELADARALVKDKTDKDITVRHLIAEASLGLPLDEFIAVAIAGIQQVAPEIGL
jgi:predicted hydrolase (HD superfamily)